MSRTPVNPEILDLRHLTAQTFSDRALARELLELFGRQCRALGAVIIGATGAGSREERSRAAHTLKGSACAIGAWRIAAVADWIEALVADPGTRSLAELSGELEDAVNAVEAAIAACHDA